MTVYQKQIEGLCDEGGLRAFVGVIASPDRNGTDAARKHRPGTKTYARGKQCPDGNRMEEIDFRIISFDPAPDRPARP
jgi:hypothetical protein